MISIHILIYFDGVDVHFCLDYHFIFYTSGELYLACASIHLLELDLYIGSNVLLISIGHRALVYIV